MRDIESVYEEYQIMPNLREHMLRVAGVATLICDAIDCEIDRGKLILGALLHDMGNIIKFNLNYFPEFLEPEGYEYWAQIQEGYFEKYGRDEHHATTEIMKELNVRSDITIMVSEMVFGALCEHQKSNNLELKILHYADMRVGPFGVLSYEDRMEDVRKRYANVPHDEFTRTFQSEREKLLACGKDIETEIFSMCSINPVDINDERVNGIIPELKSFKF